MLKYLALAAFTLLPLSQALASSEDAWSQFAAEVEQACLAAVEGSLSNATAVVDPFGSESYGLAVVSGDTSADESASIICVFDKQTKNVEIGGELDLATP